jgi:hypothetical protein
MNDILATTTTTGWSNWETAAAHLWVTEDEVGYQLMRTAFRQYGDLAYKAHWLERHLHATLDKQFCDANLWSDLVTTAFERINWLEIIEHN